MHHELKAQSYKNKEHHKQVRHSPQEETKAAQRMDCRVELEPRMQRPQVGSLVQVNEVERRLPQQLRLEAQENRKPRAMMEGAGKD